MKGQIVIYFVIVTISLGLLTCYIVARKKGISHWLPAYIFGLLKGVFSRTAHPQNVYFCFVDHFEPGFSSNPRMEVVDKWCKNFPEIAARHRDCRGKPPQHTFFIPIEEYSSDVTEKLSKLCQNGYGDVEVHLHHDKDTSENLRKTLLGFNNLLYNSFDLLRKNCDTGQIEYAFIHGNWALDNSRTDGRWCGVNDEISILRETGCYADFTMPSGAGSTQTRTINSIYYAIDDRNKPKSHDFGVPMKVWAPPPVDGLLMIQGPLALNWRDRKFGIIPRIEDADISWSNPPTPERIDLWIKQRIRPVGDNRSIVVKVHTHGAQTRNAAPLLDQYLDMIYSYLEKNYNDGKKYKLHYMTAHELYEKLKDIERDRFQN